MNDNIGKLVDKHRSRKNLNFRELAELCGYSNTKKWATRICNFVREGSGDDEMIRKLIQVLGINESEVREANLKDLKNWEDWLEEPVPMQLIFRLIPSVYQPVMIPDNFQDEQKAIEYALEEVTKRGFDACLVLSRRKSVWIKRDGTIKFESIAKPGIPNFPYMSV